MNTNETNKDIDDIHTLISFSLIGDSDMGGVTCVGEILSDQKDFFIIRNALLVFMDVSHMTIGLRPLFPLLDSNVNAVAKSSISTIGIPCPSMHKLYNAYISNAMHIYSALTDRLMESALKQISTPDSKPPVVANPNNEHIPVSQSDADIKHTIH